MNKYYKKSLRLASRLIANSEHILSCYAISAANMKLYTETNNPYYGNCFGPLLKEDYTFFYAKKPYVMWFSDFSPESQMARSLLLLLYAEVGDLE